MSLRWCTLLIAIISVVLWSTEYGKHLSVTVMLVSCYHIDSIVAAAAIELAQHQRMC
jgi:hypothetical protein